METSVGRAAAMAELDHLLDNPPADVTVADEAAREMARLVLKVGRETGWSLNRIMRLTPAQLRSLVRSSG